MTGQVLVCSKESKQMIISELNVIETVETSKIIQIR